ncbi:unnamed protein product [Paramecium octaurelia]|uniref:Uncharacterized protein n=1 Tax=Paramecium octaurelia TaxID=43137 RepID=A0A8S1Y0C6_PAROT|nr:unnamed protein product [Paramecium octaurelia]
MISNLFKYELQNTSNFHFLLIYFQQYNNEFRRIVCWSRYKQRWRQISRNKVNLQLVEKRFQNQKNYKPNKTLNQLLVEMGGFVFDTNFHVLVDKKTNELLYQSPTRPGRFKKSTYLHISEN